MEILQNKEILAKEEGKMQTEIEKKMWKLNRSGTASTFPELVNEKGRIHNYVVT